MEMDLPMNKEIQISGVLIKQKTVTSRKTSSRRSLQPANIHVPHVKEYGGAIQPTGETVPVGWGQSLSGTLRLDYLLTVVKNFPMMLQRIGEQASATAVLPVVAGIVDTPTGVTVDLDLMEIRIKKNMKKVPMVVYLRPHWQRQWASL